MLAMENTFLLLLMFAGQVSVTLQAPTQSRPHILFIVADDLGWNDVGFHNPTMHTPNIDRLTQEGVIFDQAYVQPVCSPSGTSFMSGMYPFKTGMQHTVLFPQQPVCVPLNYTFLPQELKTLGYATHMVGKWHLGFCKWECTPTYRGFDTFFGYYNGAEDYYTHKIGSITDSQTKYLDYRDNLAPATNYTGEYSTYTYANKAIDIIKKHDQTKPLFLYLPFQNVHTPIEVPKIYEDMYPNVINNGRRKFCEMVTAMDDAIGNITDALKEEGLYNNTIILFTSDNGGWLPHYGNNYPLRGGKMTIWEGGTRGASFMSGAGLESQAGKTYDGLIHAIDWKPTLVAAAGGIPETNIDGMNLWDAIRHGTPSQRTEFVYNIDDFRLTLEGHAAVRVGNFKLIEGYPGQYDAWLPPMNGTQDSTVTKSPFTRGDTPVRLFNIKNDPLEKNNLAQSPFLSLVLRQLQTRLEFYRKQMVPANFPAFQSSSDPRNYNNVWSPGWC